MSARPGEHAPAAWAAGRAASRAARRPWRDYWQLVPVALLMCALVAVDRFRRGAQAAGLVNAGGRLAADHPDGAGPDRGPGPAPGPPDALAP